MDTKCWQIFAESLSLSQEPLSTQWNFVPSARSATQHAAALLDMEIAYVETLKSHAVAAPTLHVSLGSLEVSQQVVCSSQTMLWKGSR